MAWPGTRRAGFLDLPAELRIIIYEQATVVETRHHEINLPYDAGITIVTNTLSSVALLSTCRLINQDAYPIKQKLNSILRLPPRIIMDPYTGMTKKGGHRLKRGALREGLFQAILSAIRSTDQELRSDTYWENHRSRRKLLIQFLSKVNIRSIARSQSDLHVLASFIYRAGFYLNSLPHDSESMLPAFEVGLRWIRFRYYLLPDYTAFVEQFGTLMEPIVGRAIAENHVWMSIRLLRPDKAGSPAPDVSWEEFVNSTERWRYLIAGPVSGEDWDWDWVEKDERVPWLNDRCLEVPDQVLNE